MGLGMTDVSAPEKELEVEAVLQWGRLEIVGSPQWQLEPQEVRAELPVRNAGGHPVRMHIRILRPLPWRYHFVLNIGRLCVRRLDVRDSHTNPDEERERWVLRTHKHRFTDRWGDRWAYTPDDLPPTQDGGEVTAEEYREVFEAYCRECNIDTSQLVWEDPPITVRTAQ
jgi:hypothetical protein